MRSSQSPVHRRTVLPILLFLLALIVLGSIGLKLRRYLLHPSTTNLYTLQAEAFLHGQAAIRPGYYDEAVYQGRSYVPFPPFPALLLLPTTALLGITPLPVLFLNVVLTALNVRTLWRILRRLEVAPEAVPWLLVAFFLGTAYWLTIIHFPETYFIAHLAAITAMLLAIDEALGKGRGLLVGSLLGVAFLSRQLSLYTAPFFLVALWMHGDPIDSAIHGSRTANLLAFLAIRRSRLANLLAFLAIRRSRIANLLAFALGLGACVVTYLAFNWLRFGNPLDTGYAYISLEGFLKQRVERYGLFNLAYLPFNLVHMFLQGFHIRFDSRDLVTAIQMDSFGTSLPFASPFVLLAFWARWKKWLLGAAWIAIILPLANMLLYYNNGWIQDNAQRFTLDFMPILIVLVALGSGKIQGKVWKAAVVLAVLLNALALFGVPLIQALQD